MYIVKVREFVGRDLLVGAKQTTDEGRFFAALRMTRRGPKHGCFINRPYLCMLYITARHMTSRGVTPPAQLETL
jgi:hypothetical protein